MKKSIIVVSLLTCSIGAMDTAKTEKTTPKSCTTGTLNHVSGKNTIQQTSLLIAAFDAKLTHVPMKKDEKGNYLVPHYKNPKQILSIDPQLADKAITIIYPDSPRI